MPYLTTDDVSDAEAHYHLGLAYQNGDGVPYDLIEGERLLRLAAGHDHLDAIMILARQYLHGVNVSKNTKEAARLYQIAAYLGNHEAQFQLGNILITEKDMKNAMYWWDKAAINGNETAHRAYLLYLTATNAKDTLNQLAKSYYYMGKEALAIEVWERGAELGDSECQYELGSILYSGQRRSEGMDWLEVAAAAGNEKAKDAIARVYETASEVDSIDSI
jgi:TPR repeat protein